MKIVLTLWKNGNFKFVAFFVELCQETILVRKVGISVLTGLVILSTCLHLVSSDLGHLYHAAFLRLYPS